MQDRHDPVGDPRSTGRPRRSRRRRAATAFTMPGSTARGRAPRSGRADAVDLFRTGCRRTSPPRTRGANATMNHRPVPPGQTLIHSKTSARNPAAREVKPHPTASEPPARATAAPGSRGGWWPREPERVPRADLHTVSHAKAAAARPKRTRRPVSSDPQGLGIDGPKHVQPLAAAVGEPGDAPARGTVRHLDAGISTTR